MLADAVDADPHNFAVALVELGLETGHGAKLRRAHRREVLRMGKQNRPTVADPVVKVDRAFGGISGEVRGFVVDSECHDNPP